MILLTGVLDFVYHPVKKKKIKVIPIQAVEALGLREVEAPTFSDIRLIDGGKVVSPTLLLLLLEWLYSPCGPSPLCSFLI
jgi:hypothetical protein